MISVSNLTKKYHNDTYCILDNITYNFQEGNIYCITGKNGSGKTVFLRSLCGFIKPTKGKITIDNKELGKDIEFIENCGFLLDRPAFIPYYSAQRNLECIQNKFSKKELNVLIKKSMQSVGLDYLNSKSLKTYSMGMQQRLAIAQAILSSPKHLILDEPFNYLDISGINVVKAVLANYITPDKIIIITSNMIQDISDLPMKHLTMKFGKLSDLSQES